MACRHERRENTCKLVHELQSFDKKANSLFLTTPNLLPSGNNNYQVTITHLLVSNIEYLLGKISNILEKNLMCFFLSNVSIL